MLERRDREELGQFLGQPRRTLLYRFPSGRWQPRHVASVRGLAKTRTHFALEDSSKRENHMATRTTHRSSAGKKLYAVRDASGRFKDIQTYERAHRADLKRKSKAETKTAKKH